MEDCYEIFISNGHLSRMCALSSVDKLAEADLHNIEISTGSVDANTLAELKKRKKSGLKFRLHNFFPNFEENFVLNLCSPDPVIVKQSKQLINRALEWSSELESDFYAFHAGFRINLEPFELDGRLSKKQQIPIDEAHARFFQEISNISLRANSLGVKLAIENNVYDASNLRRYGRNNPFLFCGDIESESKLPENVGMLMDVGHLNVSAKSLGFDRYKAMRRLSNSITGYHLSENKGVSDDNDHIEKKSWFFALLKPDVRHITLEIYDSDLRSLHRDIEITKNFFKKVV